MNNSTKECFRKPLQIRGRRFEYIGLRQSLVYCGALWKHSKARWWNATGHNCIGRSFRNDLLKLHVIPKWWDSSDSSKPLKELIVLFQDFTHDGSDRSCWNLLFNILPNAVFKRNKQAIWIFRTIKSWFSTNSSSLKSLRYYFLAPICKYRIPCRRVDSINPR